MKLLVGLGNPGRQYQGNRHNVGFMVLDELASQCGANWSNRFAGEVSRVELDRGPLYLLKPMTYMNRSGASVQPMAAFYRIEPSEICVVHDEIDLPYETLRVKIGGGHGGHNGLRDIIQRLASSDFFRLRIGVGRPPHGGDAADFVLNDFSSDERITLEQVVERSIEIVRFAHANGPRKAMNDFNGKGLPGTEAETVH
ncbi:MAG: aminoacyl-tRNA hydrolase [Myxococcales bacterium]|nr:aminoacyl-tRNA hydrolase [Myxococcales bacterium]